jgi:hypothetical protein
MMERYTQRLTPLLRRALPSILAVLFLFALIPLCSPKASAESWMDPYLDKVVEWGVMRGDIDGNLEPDRNITRAEFVTMVNRAYGYNDPGTNPFKDVSSSDWYYDDICTAYKVGYFSGTSNNTASPNQALTREQAAMILARNMMLQESTGEVLTYTDSRTFSEWSRSLVQAATDAGVIAGYPDGTFRPQSQVTRGEVACMLVSAIGTPVQEAGNYTLGSTYGNVTITSAGVTLRDTTIAGDLYLSGGVGLGDVQLENVTVLGKIVVAGSGESEAGESSVLLRNVTADSMIVDSISDQFVTIRSEGDTNIGTTSVRTSSYIEDVTDADAGLSTIQLDGEAGNSLQLAGNVKEVVNLTPSSTLTLAQGSADVVTVDEAATGTTLNIDMNARVKSLNLDTATTVSGAGDIADLTVNAAGVTVTQLPDEITVRPGLTASIAGTSMDTVAASESSSIPRLLAGYPTAKNIAPTTAEVVFSTNKAGTVYWAISALTDGSVSETDLITTPAYSGKILKSGNIAVTASKTEVTAKVTGLTSDGSYYISAVLVDSRGERSAVKVSAFTTPDDTVPAFASGYPTMTKIESDRAQVTVMPTKSCLLYYALLPKGSTAPKAADFKSNAVTGNLGYGAIDVVKNTTTPFWVNSVPLDEQVSYDLYLWMTDYDGVKSSAVKKVSFTTIDGTAPLVRSVSQTDTKANAVGVTFALNEPGTLYWSVVKESDADTFLLPLTGQTVTPDYTDPAAKLQVENGVGALKKGNSSASKGDTNTTFTVSGLTAETNYVLFYIAKDKAGNYSDAVQTLKIYTLDTNAPTVQLEFTRYNGENPDEPLANTDVRLVFSESIQVSSDDGKSYYTLIDKYQAVTEATTEAEQAEAREVLAELLRSHIEMYEVPTNGIPELVPERTASSDAADDWVIDFRYAQVTSENSKMIITFPHVSNNLNRSGISLSNGTQYRFILRGFADTSIGSPSSPNVMSPTSLDFKTINATINLSGTNVTTISKDEISGGGTADVRVDISFQLDPMTTSSVPNDEYWDMLLWSDTPVSFELYRRTDGGTWEKLGNSQRITSEGGVFSGISLHRKFVYATEANKFDPLKTGLEEGHIYEYGIHFTQVSGDETYENWSSLVTIKVGIVAGSARELGNLADGVTIENWNEITATRLNSIGRAYANGSTSDELVLKKQFSDQNPPHFINSAPTMPTAYLGSTVVRFAIEANRPCTVYYVVAPKDQFVPYVGEGVNKRAINKDNDHDLQNNKDTYVPTSGAYETPELTDPSYLKIVNQNFSQGDIKYGKQSYTSATLNIDVSGLLPSTEYYVYFVLKGSGETYSSYPLLYQFTTTEVQTPIVSLQVNSPSVTIATDTESYVYYALVEETNVGFLSGKFDSTDSAYSNLTILEALTQPSGTKSLFDVYASESQRQKVQEYISGNQSFGDAQPKFRGEISRLNATSYTKDFTQYMTTGTQYYVLAAARHVNGESFGFRGVAAVFLPDTTPPQYMGGTYLAADIDYATLTSEEDATHYYSWDWSQVPNQFRYTGSVTITFDEPVYQVTTSGGTKTRKTVEMRGEVTDTTETVSVLDVLGGNGRGQCYIDPDDAYSGPTKTFTISFKNLRNNQTIVFFNNGYLGNADGNYTEKTLCLTFDTSLIGTDYDGKYTEVATPGFRVEWISGNG